jgi:hypothetical protein
MEFLAALILGTVVAFLANAVYSLAATGVSGRFTRSFEWVYRASLLAIGLFALYEILLAFFWLQSDSETVLLDFVPLPFA